MKSNPDNAFGNIAGWLFHPLAACLGLGVLAGGCARLTATGLHCENLRCEYLRQENGKVVFEVGSGTYDFASKLDRP